MPYALAGHSTVGFLLGVAALQIGATLAIAAVANRRGGPALALPALLAVSVLGWALDGPSLTEALNPFLVILPFLAFLFLSWDVSLGEERSLVVAGVTASLVVQFHTSYGLVVAGVSVAAVTGLALSVRRRWANFGPQRRGALTSSLRRAVIGTVGALVVCWMPPLVQQVRSDHPNLSALFEGLSPGSRAYRPSAGFARAALQATLGIRPLWASQGQRAVMGTHTASTWSALAVLVALVGLGVWAWSHRHRPVAWLLTLAGVSLATAYLSARAAPNQLDPQSFRYLWAIGPFVAVSVVWAAVEAIRLAPRNSALGPPFRRVITRPARRLAAAATIALMVVTVTAACVATDPTGSRADTHEAASRRAVLAVTPQVLRRVDRRPIHVVATYGETAFFAVGPSLVRNLDQHGLRLRAGRHGGLRRRTIPPRRRARRDPRREHRQEQLPLLADDPLAADRPHPHHVPAPTTRPPARAPSPRGQGLPGPGSGGHPASVAASPLSSGGDGELAI